MSHDAPTHLDLFSGIGGFAIAAQWAGFRTVGFCEIEPYAQAILKARFEGIPNFGDIRDLICALRNRNQQTSPTWRSATPPESRGGSSGNAGAAGNRSHAQSQLWSEAGPSVAASADTPSCAQSTPQIMEEGRGCGGQETQDGEVEFPKESASDYHSLPRSRNGEGWFSIGTATNVGGAENALPDATNSGRTTSRRGHSTKNSGSTQTTGSRSAKTATNGFTAQQIESVFSCGRVDLVTAGVPCQPASCAGKRRGPQDDRWLWPEAIAVVELLHPRWIIFENVAGFITLNGGLELDRVLSDLEAIGYTTGTLVIPACAVDAKHRRDRVWIVGHAAGELSWPRGPGRHKARREATDAGQDMANPIRSGLEIEQCQPGHDGEELPAAERSGDEWLRWEPEPAVGRSIDGFSAWLEQNHLTTVSHKPIMAHAKAAKARPGEILRALRDSVDSENIQWTAGGCNGVLPSQILLTYLRQLETETFDEARLQLESEEASGGEVRCVRTRNKPSRTPSGSGHQQQRSAEHPDTLQALSRLLAQHSQEAWQSYRWSNAETVLNPWGDGWEIGIPRVAKGVPNRVARLKGLGNAIVPQVAFQILQEIRRML